MNIVWKGSPNHNKGRAGTRIDRIVIHWFGKGTLEAANTRFQNPANQVSAHYGIFNGRVWQWVREEDTAWHSGNLAMNRRSIGIENDAGIEPPHNLSEQDYRTLGEVVASISKRHGIPLDRTHVIGHRDVKPTACPGSIDLDKVITLAKSMTTTLKIKVLANRQNWNFRPQLEAVRSWYETKSAGRVLVDFQIEETDLAPVPWSNSQVDSVWYDSNVLPRAIGFDAVVLMLDHWNGTSGSVGRMSGDSEQKTMKIQAFTPEHHGEYVMWTVAHEISHVLFYLTVGEPKDPTHQLFSSDNEFNRQNAHKIFDVLEFQTLSAVLRQRRAAQQAHMPNQTRVVLGKDGKTVYLATPVAMDFENFKKQASVEGITVPDPIPPARDL
jgi:N-acetyl-anhydromuramyl-L-alanine amidase AmpD